MSAALSAAGEAWLPDIPSWKIVLHLIDITISFAIVTALFAAIYKWLPRATIAWGDVWTGAAVTALLFTVGKLLIGLYIGKSGIASGFGRRCVNRCADDLGVLLGTDFPSWCGVHLAVRVPFWLAPRTTGRQANNAA
jgi:hypothetical protein